MMTTFKISDDYVWTVGEIYLAESGGEKQIVHTRALLGQKRPPK